MVQSLLKPRGASFWSCCLKHNLQIGLRKFTCEKPNLWQNAPIRKIMVVFWEQCLILSILSYDDNIQYVELWIVNCAKWHHCYSVRNSSYDTTSKVIRESKNPCAKGQNQVFKPMFYDSEEIYAMLTLDDLI